VDGFVKPLPKDKFPACGMFAAKSPGFVAEIVFNEGPYAVFDGAKGMAAKNSPTNKAKLFPDIPPAPTY